MGIQGVEGGDIVRLIAWLGAVYWLCLTVALFFGYEPYKSTVATAFVLVTVEFIYLATRRDE